MPISRKSFNLDAQIGSICTDSRLVKKGSFFIPLIGEKYNGHNFLMEALSKGAEACVVAKKYQLDVPEDFVYWVVEDTVLAYQEIALLHRSALDIPVVAITGSTGKTTTRELISSALSPLGNIVSSLGNNNNDIGVPLTLLEAKDTDSAVVLEMGMRALGEIRRLSFCASPDIAVITNIGSAHLGRLGSRSNIAVAKCEITACLKPNGVVIVPAIDRLLEDVLLRNWIGRIVTVAIKDDIEKECTSFRSYGKDYIDYVGDVNLQRGTIEIEGKSLNLPLEGRHNARNFLLAIAVAKELGLPLKSLDNLKVEMPGGRNNYFNYGSITILDESYNSSPESVKASFEILLSKPGRHFAVLGTMLELGAESIELHRQVANWAVKLGLDGMVIVSSGEEAHIMKKEARNLPNLAVVSSPEEAAIYLNLWLKRGDVLLVKGSRALALERLFPLLNKIN